MKLTLHCHDLLLKPLGYLGGISIYVTRLCVVGVVNDN